MNSDKLNHLIRLKANELSLNVELVYRNYMFERFLERLSHSIYKDSFIVKEIGRASCRVRVFI